MTSLWPTTGRRELPATGVKAILLYEPNLTCRKTCRAHKLGVKWQSERKKWKISLTFLLPWDNIIKDTAKTEHEYPPAPPDREGRLWLQASHGKEEAKTASAAGPETGAVPFPQQKV